MCRFRAFLRRRIRPGRRVQQRQEDPVPHAQQAVGGDQAPAQHVGAPHVGRLVGHGVLDVHPQPPQRERRRCVRDRQPQARRQRPPGAHHLAVPVRSQRLDVLATGNGDQLGVLPPVQIVQLDGHVELVRGGLVERQVALGRPPPARPPRRTHRPRRVVALTGAEAAGTADARAAEPTPWPPAGTRFAAARCPPSPRRSPWPARATRSRPGVRARRTATAPGSSPTTPGTGRAGNPRTARRPPPGAPTRIPQAVRVSTLGSTRNVGLVRVTQSHRLPAAPAAVTRCCHTVPYRCSAWHRASAQAHRPLRAAPRSAPDSGEALGPEGPPLGAAGPGRPRSVTTNLPRRVGRGDHRTDHRRPSSGGHRHRAARCAARRRPARGAPNWRRYSRLNCDGLS